MDLAIFAVLLIIGHTLVTLPVFSISRPMCSLFLVFVRGALWLWYHRNE